MVCQRTNVATECNGAVGYNNNVGNTGSYKSHHIYSRLLMKAQSSGPTSVGGINAAEIRWHQDFVLASFFHSTFPYTSPDFTGQSWCSQWLNTLENKGETKILRASTGFTGKTKCTWQVISKLGTMAPSIYLTWADYTNFYFQWVEWLDRNTFTKDSLLPEYDRLDYHLGNYQGNQLYFNPAQSGVVDYFWKNSDHQWSVTDRDPAKHISGSIGDVIFYPNSTGPFRESQTYSMDPHFIYKLQGIKVKEFNAYLEAFEKYKTQADYYNSLVLLERQRLNNLRSRLFDQPIELPIRPCPPTEVAPYNGFVLDLKRALGSKGIPWSTNATLQGMYAYLKVFGDNLPSSKFYNRIGNLQTVSQNAPEYVGHVFGRLG